MWAAIVIDAKWCEAGNKKKVVQTYSCEKTPSRTFEIITDEMIRYQTPKSSLPMGGFKRRELHHPCYLPIYFTGSMRVRKKKLFSCPLYPIFILEKKVPRCFIPIRPKLLTKNKQNKESDRQHILLQPSILRLS